MDQELAVNRTIQNLKMVGLLSEQFGSEAKLYLNHLYVAGFEEGKRRITANFKKAITLYNIPKQKKEQTFESAAEASRRMKILLRTIYHSIQRDSLSRQGFYWKYES